MIVFNYTAYNPSLANPYNLTTNFTWLKRLELTLPSNIEKDTGFLSVLTSLQHLGLKAVDKDTKNTLQISKLVQLDELVVHYSLTETVLYQLTALSRLSHLQLLGYKNYSKGLQPIQVLTTLQSLTIERSQNLAVDWSYLTKLICLKFRGIEKQNYLFSNSFYCLCNLQSLEVNFHYDHRRSDLINIYHQISKNFVNLTYLYIKSRHCAEAKEFLSSLTKLQDLWISDKRPFSILSLSNLVHLTRLRFSDHSDYDEEYFSYTIQQSEQNPWVFTKLQQLQISGDAVTIYQLYGSLRNMELLTHLSIQLYNTVHAITCINNLKFLSTKLFESQMEEFLDIVPKLCKLHTLVLELGFENTCTDTDPLTVLSKLTQLYKLKIGELSNKQHCFFRNLLPSTVIEEHPLLNFSINY